MDPPDRRSLVDAQRSDRRLQPLRCGQSRLGPVPGRNRLDKQLAMGARRGIAGDLCVPTVPQWEASIEEVASAGVALRGGYRVGERRRRAIPGTVAGPRRGSKPVRVAPALDDSPVLGYPPAAAPVHARLGGEPGL